MTLLGVKDWLYTIFRVAMATAGLVSASIVWLTAPFDRLFGYKVVMCAVLLVYVYEDARFIVDLVRYNLRPEQFPQEAGEDDKQAR